MKAAAKGYFGKKLDELTLAAVRDPRRDPAVADQVRPHPQRRGGLRSTQSIRRRRRSRPTQDVQLVVPVTTEIVQRRNYILDLMKTRSPLTGKQHSAAEYDAAKAEPVVLAQQVPAPWRAPHFVWQVREELDRILCPDHAATPATEVDTGGYRVTTTLDWDMQKTTEKWVYAAARAPNVKDPRPILRATKIPQRRLELDPRTCGARTSTTAPPRSSTTAPARSSPTRAARATQPRATRSSSPSSTSCRDGWRQPGSAIKPINYAIGIEDQTMTASDDVHGRRRPTSAGASPRPRPTSIERGPVRLR